MRIALVNNNNNIAFSIARYLRDRGHDATVLIMGHEFAEAPHFHPSCDSFDLDYQRFTRVVPWGAPRTFSARELTQVERDLAPFDFIIGSGPTPAYMARIGRRLDVFLPWGGDLCEDPFRPYRPDIRNLRSPFEYIYWQRRGILEARAVFGDVSRVIDPQLARLGYKGRRVIASAPVPYSGVYCPDSISAYRDRTPWLHAVRELRDRSDILIHAPARHIWRTTIEFNYTKGNDKLLRAVAELKRRRPDARVGVVFYEYGPDVEASRALGAELGLTSDILWLPLSPRRDVMVNLSVCDFGVSEIGEESWYTGGVILETLCMGKPLINHRNDAEFAACGDELYPMVQGRDLDGIVRALEGFLDDPAPYRELGERGRAWFTKYVTDRALSKLEELMGEAPRRPQDPRGAPAAPRAR